MPGDLDFQDISTVQSNLQPSPVTLASAATVAPTTGMTLITGTVQIATITPPVTGYHMLVFVFTNGAPGALLTSGNIVTAAVPIQNEPVAFFYDPAAAQYYVGALLG